MFLPEAVRNTFENSAGVLLKKSPRLPPEAERPCPTSLPETERVKTRFGGAISRLPLPAIRRLDEGGEGLHRSEVKQWIAATR